MNIHASARRDVEHALRQDQTVGGDDHRVVRGLAEQRVRSARVVVVLAADTQAPRLSDFDRVIDGERLDRPRLHLQPASCRTIRLGEHEHDFMR